MSDHNDHIGGNQGLPDAWDTPTRLAKYREINRLIPTLFPELAADFDREIVRDDWEDQAPMVVYCLVFYPFFAEALRSESDDSPLLDRLVSFLRVLETHPDDDVSFTATIGIAELLVDEPELCARARPLLGPGMRATIEKFHPAA